MRITTAVGGDMDMFASALRTMTILGIVALVILYPDILNGLLTRFNNVMAGIFRLGQANGGNNG